MKADDVTGSVSHATAFDLVAIFLGGVLGTLARWAVGVAVRGDAPIVVVNAVGSFLLGVVVGLLVGAGTVVGRGPGVAPESVRVRVLRRFLATGFCGAFTTYSAWALLTSERLGKVGSSGSSGDRVGAVVGQAGVELVGFCVAAAAGLAVSGWLRGVWVARERRRRR